jgi:cellulose synthase/poly-beta-1,6-N-acetylglucosamine synthase-like glycosyltransferase
MLLLLILASVVLVCAAVPCALFCVNLRRYTPPLAAETATERVAVLIPARNEEANIAACVESVLASTQTSVDVLVLDDASTDSTAAIVRSLAQRDPRVRLLPGQPLPVGWNGKQHACWLLAQATDAPLLLFLDADVRLAPDTLARCATQLRASRIALLSGFPRQITLGWMEWLLLPLIHFVLLGFLPMGRMRSTTRPSFAAGCGQFFLADRTAYFASGGHAAIRSTRHDGLRLTQSFRRAGLRTDLVDLTELASVRMYDSPLAVWMGLAKNATEGLAAPARIVPLSLILVLGQVLPTLLAVLWCAFYVSSLVMGATFDQPRRAALVSALLAMAVVASYLPRILSARRFKQPIRSALLHPWGVLMLLAIQWYALARQLLRSPIAWRGRS